LKRFVLDCSVTMAWCFEDETAGYADMVLEKFGTSEAVVPSIWPLEVANVLLVGERRGRLTTADTVRFLTLLRAMPILVDEESAYRLFDEVLALAREQNLSSYDAAYLEVAMRQGCPLTTLDDSLCKAAANVGVAVLTK